MKDQENPMIAAIQDHLDRVLSDDEPCRYCGEITRVFGARMTQNLCPDCRDYELEMADEGRREAARERYENPNDPGDWSQWDHLPDRRK